MTFQGSTADIGAGRQNAGVHIAADQDAAAFGVGIAAVGFDLTVHHNATAIRQEVHLSGLRGRGVDAARLQHTGHRAVNRRGLHIDLAALGHDDARLFILDPCVHRCRRQLQLDLSAAAHGHVKGLGQYLRQNRRITRTHDHCALGRQDAALVLNRGPQQGHIATRR